jgi:hypothetical protein
MVIDTNPFPYALYMGGAPRWVIADESLASTTPHNHSSVPKKSPQYTTIKGFTWYPWSWTSFVNLL